MLNLQPTRGVDSEPVPANSQLVRQAELRSEPGTRNSSLPRAVAFCCPHLISMHSGMRGRVPLAWAPDLTHAGDVLVPMWMCEVCSVPLLWTDFVSAATFPVSSDFLELVGSCPEHRASARYRVSRSSGTSNLETCIQYQCGCRVSLDTISSLDWQPADAAIVAPTGLPTIAQQGALAPSGGGPPPPAPGALEREQSLAPNLQPAHLLPPRIVTSNMYSSVLVPLLFDAANLLSPAAHQAWINDERSAPWWEISILQLRQGDGDVDLDWIAALVWRSEYCLLHGGGEVLSNACVETLRILRLDAQRRDSAQISLRRALEILLHTFQDGSDYRPDDLRYNYLAGELQEVFLLAFGGDELALAVNNNLTSFSRRRNVAQPASQPAPPSASRT